MNNKIRIILSVPLACVVDLLVRLTPRMSGSEVLSLEEYLYRIGLDPVFYVLRIVLGSILFYFLLPSIISKINSK